MTKLKLVLRNLMRNRLRTFLTFGALVVAFFLLVTLRSLITTLSAGVDAASTRRLIVQSAVSLFVTLPSSYQSKIEGVEGVETLGKWQWFGGYYQEPGNRFAQFAVDPEELLSIYPEVDVVEGSNEAFLAEQRGCLVGQGLVDKYGWELGQTVPIIGEIFPNPADAGGAWEFVIAGIYDTDAPNFDRNTMFFHWKYFEESMETGPLPVEGPGTYAVLVERSADPPAVMARIDALFAGGPQRVQATTEAEFQRQFVSMLGSVPFFLTTIGGAVLAAILMSCVNIMLMAAREQTRDIGVIKALGFSNGAASRMLLAQSLALSVLGGGFGILLAKVFAPFLAAGLAMFFPNYQVENSTLILAGVLAAGVGLLAGLLPAFLANRLDPVNALRAVN